MFDWQDAVINVKMDGSDISEIISKFSKQPERMLEISRRNTSESLLRHDWMYRWEKILKIAGLKPTYRMEERRQLLRVLADMVQADRH